MEVSTWITIAQGIGLLGGGGLIGMLFQRRSQKANAKTIEISNAEKINAQWEHLYKVTETERGELFNKHQSLFNEDLKNLKKISDLTDENENLKQKIQRFERSNDH